MLPDTCTKLATSPVILVLHDAMDAIQPNHKTSMSPGQQNQSDEAGDGPPGRQTRHTSSVFSGTQNRGDEAGDGPSGVSSPSELAMLREILLKCGLSRETKTKNHIRKGHLLHDMLPHIMMSHVIQFIMLLFLSTHCDQPSCNLLRWHWSQWLLLDSDYPAAGGLLPRQAKNVQGMEPKASRIKKMWKGQPALPRATDEAATADHVLWQESRCGSTPGELILMIPSSPSR